MNPVSPSPVRKSSISNGTSWYYTYVLKSKRDGKFYTGTTNNLKQRLGQHSKGLVTSTKYKRPLSLIYYEACSNNKDAYRREKYLKSGMGKKYLRNRLKKGLTG